jgi:ubiquitin C-terminal hydrolase
LRSEAPRGREPTTYNLFAVVNHYGHAGSGHYTALARHQVSGAWYEFDDESVTRVEVGQVKSAAAYLLCYERTDLAS